MRIRVQGLDINYKFTGEGEETVVMLQGWGTSLSVYDSVAAIFDPERYRFLQFDLPGFGDSEEPSEPWNVERYCEFFCALMEEFSIERASLLGHSYGGRIIIRLADRDKLPFEIVRIALIDSAGILPERTLAKTLKIKRYKLLKKIFDIKIIEALFPELCEDWRRRQGSEDYRKADPIMRQSLVMAVNEDLTELLPRISAETLLIWGDKDTATPMRDARIMEERIPGAGLAVIEGAGHYCFLDNPRIFKSIILAFFK